MIDLRNFARHMPKEPYSEGTVSRDANGNWLGVWYVYQEVDGQRKRRRRIKVLQPTTMTKPEAREKLRALVYASRGQATPMPPAVNLDHLWKRYCTYKDGNWSKGTSATLQSLMKDVLSRQVAEWRLGEIALPVLTLEPLQFTVNAMAREGCSTSKIQKARIQLRAMLEYGVEERMIQANPARRLTIPKRVKKPSERYYTVEEVHLLLSRATGRDHLIIRLFLVAGLRPAELFALRVNDVQKGEIYIDEALKQAETGKDRIGDPKTPESENGVAIPESLEKEIRMWIASQKLSGDDFLFPAATGQPFHPKNYLRRKLRRIVAKPGAKYNEKIGDWNRDDLLIPDLDYQAMRRTCATYFRNNLTAAQRQLRHATPIVTAKHYRKAITEDVRAAVEALDRELCPQTIPEKSKPAAGAAIKLEDISGLVN
jgi:integrase